MSIEKSIGSRFAVDLGEVKLPEEIERRVASEIQAAVLRGLADAGTDSSRKFDNYFIGQFPGGWAGLIWGDDTRVDLPEWVLRTPGR